MKLKVKTSLLEFSKFNIVTILSKLVAVFFLPFLTTLLPKEEIGIISIYTRLIGLLSILFGLVPIIGAPASIKETASFRGV